MGTGTLGKNVVSVSSILNHGKSRLPPRKIHLRTSGQITVPYDTEFIEKLLKRKKSMTRKRLVTQWCSPQFVHET